MGGDSGTSWFVYFAWVIVDMRLYAKVGYSSHSLDRVESWAATGTPAPIHHVYSLRCGKDKQFARNLESKLHESLEDYHLIREWFTGNSVYGEDLYCHIADIINDIGYSWKDSLCLHIHIRKLKPRFERLPIYQLLEDDVFSPVIQWLVSGLEKFQDDDFGRWLVRSYANWTDPGDIPDIDTLPDISLDAAKILKWSERLSVPKNDLWNFVVKRGLRALDDGERPQSVVSGSLIL